MTGPRPSALPLAVALFLVLVIAAVFLVREAQPDSSVPRAGSPFSELEEPPISRCSEWTVSEDPDVRSEVANYGWAVTWRVERRQDAAPALSAADERRILEAFDDLCVEAGPRTSMALTLPLLVKEGLDLEGLR